MNAERLSPAEDRHPFRSAVNVEPALSDHIISCNPVEFHLVSLAIGRRVPVAHVSLPSWRTVPELQQRFLSRNIAITFYDPKTIKLA
jgi:hypothetical protein